MHALLWLKAAHASLSNDSLNSGSTNDGYCPRENKRPCPLAALAEHREELLGGQPRPARRSARSRPEGQPGLGPTRDAAGADTRVGTIKLSPTYQPVLPLESAGRAGAPRGPEAGLVAGRGPEPGA